MHISNLLSQSPACLLEDFTRQHTGWLRPEKNTPSAPFLYSFNIFLHAQMFPKWYWSSRELFWQAVTVQWQQQIRKMQVIADFLSKPVFTTSRRFYRPYDLTADQMWPRTAPTGHPLVAYCSLRMRSFDFRGCAQTNAGYLRQPW